MASVTYTTFNGMVVHENRGGTERDYMPDPIGSTAALLDSSQAKTDTWDYWPYGETASQTGSSPTPFKYLGTRGYYQDLTTLAYVRSGHLVLSFGRWNKVDQLWPFQKPYQYGKAAPSIYVDPTGHLAFVVVALVYVGGAILLTGGAGQHSRCGCGCVEFSGPGQNFLNRCIVAMNSCGMGKLTPHLERVCWCELASSQEAFGITDPGSNVISLDYDLWKRPFYDGCTTAIHESLHAHCGIYNEEPQHSLIGEWADFLGERCKRCGASDYDPDQVCAMINAGVSPPSYVAPCSNLDTGTMLA